jgi:F-type H+/Na+-transporting ATPase subunit alpha
MVNRSPEFQKLVDAGQPTGEVIGVDRCLVTIKGLRDTTIGALVMFENGDQGLVRQVTETGAIILNLDREDTALGTVLVLVADQLTVGVGEQLIGRVVSPLGRPLDNKGATTTKIQQPVFATAPGISERALLNEQLATGTTIVDVLFPIVLGQRIGILGDTRSGKTAFLTSLVQNQTKTNRVVVYVMISKRRVDIDSVLAKLQESGAMEHTIVVVASIFDSIAQSYIAPYTACAMAEYLWQQGRDVVIVYDDLTSHAKVYRELSLLARVNPGRDSYPGDMFYAHSSLLERAGKLASNNKTLTAIPVVLTPNDDITAYMPTSIMSITDGQIILDLASFRQGIRPAVNAGLSVSRVGGRAQTASLKKIGATIFKKLAAYRRAAEFSHFGSELALESQADFELGKRLYEAFKQTPDERYTLAEQELILQSILATEGKIKVNVDSLKVQARELAKSLTAQTDIGPLVQRLVSDNAIQVAK